MKTIMITILAISMAVIACVSSYYAYRQYKIDENRKEIFNGIATELEKLLDIQE